MPLDIKRELAAVDLRNYNFYENLTAEEKKEFSPYILMRYVSNASGDREVQEYFLEMVNELVNKNHWVLSKNHKALLWKLFAGCGIGSKFYHPYLKLGTKEKSLKIEKLLLELEPTAKLSDIKLKARMMTPEDRAELFDLLGFDQRQRKEYE
jgi:hypothetical protein